MSRERKFLVKEKDNGFCIVDEDNYTITSPNGICKKIEQYEISRLKEKHRYQKMRGIFL